MEVFILFYSLFANILKTFYNIMKSKKMPLKAAASKLTAELNNFTEIKSTIPMQLLQNDCCFGF